jgi:hypothetical protein
MNYSVKAFKIIIKDNGDTDLEDYEKDSPNYTEAEKELNRLRSMGEYTNVRIIKKSNPHL